ncbi:MAG: helix-turn-helix domain-containing protein [Acidobacteria bacterium]|nr:helix-turn-helix domain-containing protein [Acidobacteriota bacterium]
MQPEEIKQKRIALNLTQSQLAERFGVERNTVARWERGEVVPQALGMLRLAFQSLEIELGLTNSGIEALRDEQREKMTKMRIRHARHKNEMVRS